MPLMECFFLDPEGEVGLWEIRETEDWFLERLLLSAEEQAQISRIRGHRRLEFLASRKLVHDMIALEQRHPLEKDLFGKPHLPHLPFSVSISHSRAYAAAMLAQGTIGVDIQHVVEKINRIAHKFLRPEEMEAIQASSRLEHLHVYWCAKEALYKAYGKRGLDFCRDILVQPFAYTGAEGAFQGRVRKGNWLMDFDLHYRLVREHMLVWAREKSSSA